MFDEQRERLEKNLKDVEDERKALDKEEQTYKQKIKELDDLEKELLSNGAKEGQQSFVLQESDFMHIDNEFISKANKWIAKHEQEHHPARFYNVSTTYRPGAIIGGVGHCSNYSVNLMWTSLGRLVSVECEDCKKKADGDHRQLEYLFCDEA